MRCVFFDHFPLQEICQSAEFEFLRNGSLVSYFKSVLECLHDDLSAVCWIEKRPKLASIYGFKLASAFLSPPPKSECSIKHNKHKKSKNRNKQIDKKHYCLADFTKKLRRRKFPAIPTQRTAFAKKDKYLKFVR